MERFTYAISNTEKDLSSESKYLIRHIINNRGIDNIICVFSHRSPLITSKPTRTTKRPTYIINQSHLKDQIWAKNLYVNRPFDIDGSYMDDTISTIKNIRNGKPTLQVYLQLFSSVNADTFRKIYLAAFCTSKIIDRFNSNNWDRFLIDQKFSSFCPASQCPKSPLLTKILQYPRLGRLIIKSRDCFMHDEELALLYSAGEMNEFLANLNSLINLMEQLGKTPLLKATNPPDHIKLSIFFFLISSFI